MTLFAAITYAVVGVATAELARQGVPPGVLFWRLVAWLVSLVVFGSHILYGRLRRRESAVRTALHAALGAALGALLLAAGGPLRSHWGTPTQNRALLALVLWPAITGPPAFLVALVASVVLGGRAGIDALRAIRRPPDP